MHVDSSALGVAERLAGEVLFPGAPAVDAGAVPVRDRLDALAAVGLYGMAGPVEDGGLAADVATAGRVVEALAGGCLTTTLVWMQHHGAVRALDQGPPALREEWLARLCRGERRAGVAIGGIRPGVEPLRARPAEGGWVLDGPVPWVTGWGLVDAVHTAALDPGGDVVWFLVDAAAGPSLRAERLRLAAADASATVTLAFTGHPVPAARVTGTTSYEEWGAGDAAGLRANGSLALGVASRCARLLVDAGAAAEGTAVAERVDAVRARLDAADTAALPGARADAAELAWRAASLLVVARGGRSVLAGDHAQRLAREAVFLLVFGSRPPIRAGLLARLAGAAGAATG